MRFGAAVIVVATACTGADGPPLEVLVFHRETEWFHPSNPLAVQAITRLSKQRNWAVTASDDPAVFTSEKLATTDVVVFAVTSGNVLDPDTRAVLEPYFKNGGGFVGVHSASHTELDWTYYRTSLVPVSFKTHPDPYNGAPDKVLAGSLDILAPNDPIVAGLSNPWPHADEFYVFWERPEEIPGLNLLVALDETAFGTEYPDALRVGFHPLAFSHENEGVRAFYTALGHTDEAYSDPAFLRMLAQGIEWAGENRLGSGDRE
jgi:type 1 glutamine amidotransferase